MTVGLIPGSFDPFHNGHLEVVERASHIFDEIVVAAIRNPQKSESLFDLDERHAMSAARSPVRMRSNSESGTCTARPEGSATVT